MPRVPPLLTTTVLNELIAPLVPRKVPPSIVTPPTKLLLFFVRESVPDPLLTKPPAPVIRPAKVWLPVSTTVKFCPLLKSTLPPLAPPPRRDPIVSLTFTTSETPLLSESVTTPLSGIAWPLFKVSVPPVTVVDPE